MVIIQFAFRSHFAVKTYLYLSFLKKAIIVSTVKPVFSNQYIIQHGSRRRGGQGGLGLPIFLLSKYFFYIIVKENIIIDNF